MAKGEKPLLIVDLFVNNTVRQHEEETLGNQGQAKTIDADADADADANGAIASFKNGMIEFGLGNWKIQTVAFGSNGASVYVGRLNGVVAKLGVEIPRLLGVHCIAKD